MKMNKQYVKKSITLRLTMACYQISVLSPPPGDHNIQCSVNIRAVARLSSPVCSWWPPCARLPAKTRKTLQSKKQPKAAEPRRQPLTRPRPGAAITNTATGRLQPARARMRPKPGRSGTVCRPTPGGCSLERRWSNWRPTNNFRSIWRPSYWRQRICIRKII